MSPLVDGQSAVSTLRKWGSGAVLLLALEQLRCLQSARARYLVFVSPSFTEQLRVWPHVPPPFGYFRATGRVTVLPQLKVDRLCSVVDGTADCDPKATSDWTTDCSESA